MSEEKKPISLSELIDGMKERPMTLFPIGYWVVARVLQPGRSAGGIILPDAKKGDQRWGQVVAVGDGEWSGTKKVEIPLVIGDVVCLEPNRGWTITLNRKEFVVINFREVFFALRHEDGAPIDFPVT